MVDVFLLFFLIGCIGILLSVFLILYARSKLSTAHKLLQESRDKWNVAKREIETERREAALKIKDEIYKKRVEFESEIKRDRVELDRLQSKLNGKFEALEKKNQILMSSKKNCNKKSAHSLALKIRCAPMKLN